ncbi:galactose-1-phosphate uridylyltransferase [Candidatus Bipolaricaulota bacterium]|nr:galactose-1-phosphate uridylyltransferase [Candidatus Bipolaricaulota bacterium]
MSELRCGPFADQWVISAPERGRRPSDYRREEEERSKEEDCPFCPGNEQMTPPEIYRVTGEDRRWRVRVVPNKFPALQDQPRLDREAVADVFVRVNGVGSHEVVIDSPEHRKEIPDLPLEQIELIIDTYVLRLRALMEKSAHRYVLLFKNHGKEAGASLAHPHSQIIAAPIVPPAVEARLQAAKAYYKKKRRCPFCDILVEEIRCGERIIEEADGYVLLAPYDSRFPFEMAIYPRDHAHDFTAITAEQRRGLARVLKRTLSRLKCLLEDPPYNLILQTALNSREETTAGQKVLSSSSHWRIEIIPRLTRMAGFEWGSGLHINPTPPEEAARYLREVAITG